MSTAQTGSYVSPTHPSPFGSNDSHIIIYGYIPSLALSVLGIILFTLTLLIHTVLVFRHKFWSFTPLCMACAIEIIGYVFRLLSSQLDPYNIVYFVVEYFFIVTAPVLISASIYMCLTKLIRWSNIVRPNSSALRPKMVLWVFVTADVVTTVIQIVGAAMIGARTSKHRDPTTANNILLTGLAIQLMCFIIFLGLYAKFVVGLVKGGLFRKKLPFILALATSSLLVFLRTLFRLAETSQGVFGYLSSHEAIFGSLEFAPTVVTVLLLAIWHPGRWVQEVGGSAGEKGIQGDFAGKRWCWTCMPITKSWCASREEGQEIASVKDLCWMEHV